MIELIPEVRAYLDAITRSEDIAQLLQHLVYSANKYADDSEEVWQRRQAFADIEIIPNLEFLISLVKEEQSDLPL